MGVAVYSATVSVKEKQDSLKSSIYQIKQSLAMIESLRVIIAIASLVLAAAGAGM
jgi:hypothetical protein